MEVMSLCVGCFRFEIALSIEFTELAGGFVDIEGFEEVFGEEPGQVVGGEELAVLEVLDRGRVG